MKKGNFTLTYMSPGGEGIKRVGDTPLSFSYSPIPVGSPMISKLEKTNDSKIFFDEILLFPTSQY